MNFKLHISIYFFIISSYLKCYTLFTSLHTQFFRESYKGGAYAKTKKTHLSLGCSLCASGQCPVYRYSAQAATLLGRQVS